MEAQSLGRFNMLVWRGVAVMAVPAMIAVGAHDILEPQPKVETVFVLVDEETRVLHTAQARTWTFDEQAKADVARNWVFDIRNRNPQHNPTRLLRQQARRYTGDGTPAVRKTETMLAEMDDKLKCDETECRLGLAAYDITAVPIGTDEETNATVVAVEWRERAYTAQGKEDGPEQTWHQYIHVQPIAPINTQRVMANGTGLYVVDLTPVAPGRPRAEVAAR